MELLGEFESMDDWASWARINAPKIEALRSIDIEQKLSRHGIDSPVFGKIPPEHVSIRNKNYRESIIVRRMNSRQRALVEILSKESEIWDNPHSAIYAAEAVTPFALFMRGRFSRFIGSEYTTDQERKASLFPIAIEDLNRLSFPDASFDCAITSDVLEHVPSISLALRELRRVIKPEGLLLSTFPFTNKLASLRKAELINGKVVHYVEPEYHGNPMDPKGSLVFTVPGWDILETARNAGFRNAKMIKFASTTKGIWGANASFIDVFYARV
jgi:SAM-dependent methyltransferase